MSSWTLVQSGRVMGRFNTINECMDALRGLHHSAVVKGNHITDMIYDVKVMDGKRTFSYTIIWTAKVSV